MSPLLTVLPDAEPQNPLDMLTVDDLAGYTSSPEAEALVRKLETIREQALGEKIGLIFDLLGRGMTLQGKAYWLTQPNPFLRGVRPLDLLWAGRFNDVWAAVQSHLVGDFS